MSAKKPEIIHVHGSFDHKLHHAFITDEQKESLEQSGFKFEKAYFENSLYYSIVATRLPDQGFEPIIQDIMNDPEMPTTLTFRYAYTNPIRAAAGYGGGYCKISRKGVEWADTDAMPAMIDALKLVSKDPDLSDRSKKAIGKAMDRVEYPSELASRANRVTVMGMTVSM